MTMMPIAFLTGPQLIIGVLAILAFAGLVVAVLVMFVMLLRKKD
jgi:hypothetical protein